MQYQLMPDLSVDEFESLKADIAARGVMVPVELDEAGAVLDGHHRVRACAELGLTDYPRIIRTGMSEDEKREHVLALNLERRHLSREQRAELVARLRAEGWSLRRIGEKLGVSHEAVRGDLADAGVNKLTPAAITGTDGKQYPAKRPGVTITPQETAQTLTMLQAVEEAAEADPERFGKLVEKMDRTGKVDGVFRAVQRELAPPPPPIPEGQFSVVYADPPWEYQNSGLAGAAEDHYSTMPTLDICDLPVEMRLADNAVCFLWVTNPLLIDGLAVLSAWGFDYKTNFVWVKDKPTSRGLAFYCRGQHELLLVGARGSLLPDKGDLPVSVIQVAKRAHSRKPEEARAIIESMYPDGVRVELFARDAERNGWTLWGNEVGKCK